MNDRMSPLSFSKLMKWILSEKEAIFGVEKHFFAKMPQPFPLFNEQLELPMGPAAGPHTQLAQNIISAYVAGARFFELKTVQQLDGEDLPVAKPCIFAPDECYNVEWSTELLVSEAFNEYAKAWFALKLLSKEFKFGDACGFIFNMSVGYDLEVIQSPKIDTFINHLKDASDTPIWKECINWTLEHLHLFKHIDADYVRQISPHISSSITLSTLHGCPPATIEQIAHYLLTQKHLHTYIKCNPTLLGYDYTRNLLDQLGYDYLDFTEHHFVHDLQFDDAVPMIHRLLDLAAHEHLQFGVKLTNTFPVKVTNNQLPGEEMYMSGRSLYPLTLSVASKLATTFNGKLKMSFSGGIDAFNIRELLNTGIYPITLATTLLKPGGYNRFYQLATTLSSCQPPSIQEVNVHHVQHLLSTLPEDIRYQKAQKALLPQKIKRSVPLTQCHLTPCAHFCPINQDIPKYIRLVGEEKYTEALAVITEKNPFPFTTGTLCNHHCTLGCRRQFYETSIAIRDVKKLAAQQGFEALMMQLPTPTLSSATKVAIIGGGVAGLSCSYFLARSGIDVTLFEKTGALGGIVRHIIPEFRINTQDLNKDLQLISHYGVKFKLHTTITSFESLKKQGFDHIVVATGATKSLSLPLKGDLPIKVFDFLKTFKTKPDTLNLGQHVVVIGGGNTAMDAARAAKRVKGVESVSIVYRRTKRLMPADAEELELAQNEGILFKELLSPCALHNHQLTCEIMTLGKPDVSGRQSPCSTHTTCCIAADTVISAIGETLDASLLQEEDIALNCYGYAAFDASTLEIAPNVYAIGDCLQGPATIVKAIANAQIVSEVILSRITTSETLIHSQVAQSLLDVQDEIAATHLAPMLTDKRSTLQAFHTPSQEPSRCLECDLRCSCCVDVCPNRANVALNVLGHTEILHIDSLCNACGNCSVFCPYASDPYKDKFTLFHSLDDFNTSAHSGVYITDVSTQSIKLRIYDTLFSGLLKDYHAQPEIKNLVSTLLTDYSYLI